ncbi:OprO/OprP family phosphate-selective porin [Alloalcanivorax xenomutans]|uniref:OprO/OprP family phosphate-selective porin n=1 Tax=Alloalcanivorax xenomutans TaxID=1094342 RepID=UPI00047EE9DF|nr:porin [Alloalcanivorax xenomutans]PHS59613.1 MAG: porin [Alcanivorax sp.]WOD28697.1 porin [Alloalcanivorax xenomutans]CUR45052.1 Phosphate-specific outer membrane porin OprP; Pyrophosphate-specific outer membrane porin OprO [Alloalcanivorax xenomutans]
MMRSSMTLVLVFVGLWLSAGVRADDDLSRLKQQIEELNQKVDALSQRETAPSPWDGLEIGGALQLDYNHFDGAYNATHEGRTGSDLFPRRVRAYIGSEHGDWDYKLLMDFSEDAEIVMARLRYSGFERGPVVQLGKLREDISLEALSSSAHLVMIERSSLANTVSPYFRWGASAYQFFPSSGLRYAFGVYKNDAFGDSGKDDSERLNYATSGRLTWAPKRDQGQVLHLGFWASYRDMSGDELSASWARGEVRETPVRLVDYAAGGAPVAVDHLTQQGLELAAQWHSLLFQAEYARRELSTEDSASDLDGRDFDGYSASLSYFLTGESRAYKASQGVFRQPDGVRNAWEVAARTSRVDASSANQGTDVTSHTLGLSYYYDANLKFMLNLIRSRVSGPGAPALVGSERDANAVVLRTQYQF